VFFKGILSRKLGVVFILLDKYEIRNRSGSDLFFIFFNDILIFKLFVSELRTANTPLQLPKLYWMAVPSKNGMWELPTSWTSNPPEEWLFRRELPT
jgi:hypothetical protein